MGIAFMMYYRRQQRPLVNKFLFQVFFIVTHIRETYQSEKIRLIKRLKQLFWIMDYVILWIRNLKSNIVIFGKVCFFKIWMNLQKFLSNGASEMQKLLLQLNFLNLLRQINRYKKYQPKKKFFNCNKNLKPILKK